MKYTLNTNICPILDVGLYESNIMSEFDYFNDFVSDEKDMIDWSKASVKMYKFKEHLLRYIEDAITDILESEINPLLDSVDEFIHFDKILAYDSTRWYNFDTDTVTFKIDVPNKTMTVLYERCEGTEFDEWLKNFKSADGFISYSPYNREMFENCLREDSSRAIALMIWYLSRKELEGYQERYEDEVRENTLFGEFIDRGDENE